MIIADIVIAVILVLGLIQGVRNGIIKELAFFLAIVFGVIISKLLSPSLAIQIQSFTGWEENISLLIAYSLLFLLVAITLHLVASLITKALKHISLGWFNRLLGAVFGVLKWGLIVSVILNLFMVLNVQEMMFEGSILFTPVACILQHVLPFTEMLNEINFKSVEEQLRNLL